MMSQLKLGVMPPVGAALLNVPMRDGVSATPRGGKATRKSARRRQLPWSGIVIVCGASVALLSVMANVWGPIAGSAAFATLAAIVLVVAIAVRTSLQLLHAIDVIKRDLVDCKSEICSLRPHMAASAGGQRKYSARGEHAVGGIVVMFGTLASRPCAVFSDGSVVVETLVGNRRFDSIRDAESFVGESAVLRPALG